MLYAGEQITGPSIAITMMIGNYSSQFLVVCNQTQRVHCNAPKTDMSLEDDEIPTMDDGEQRYDMLHISK